MSLPSRIKRKKRREAPIRSPSHRKWVRSHMCCVPFCERQPIECAHVRGGGDGSLSVKPGDDKTVSLCAEHHRLSHQIGERPFAQRFGLDLQKLAAEFWQYSPHRKKWEHAA